MEDLLTPLGFDYLLAGTSLPIILIGIGLFLIRRRRYRRYKMSLDRRHTTIHLEMVLDAMFWIAVGTAFFIRPVAEIFPGDAMTSIERLVAPAARIIAIIIGIVLIWQERDADRG